MARCPGRSAMACRLLVTSQDESMAPAVTTKVHRLCDGWIWPSMASFLTACSGPEHRPTSRGGTEARGMHQVHFCPASVGAIPGVRSHTKVPPAHRSRPSADHGCPGLDAPQPRLDAPQPILEAPRLGVDAPEPRLDAPQPRLDSSGIGEPRKTNPQSIMQNLIIRRSRRCFSPHVARPLPAWR